MHTELERVRWAWPAQNDSDNGLIRCGADLVHLTEELHIRLLTLTLVMLGVAGVVTVPLAQTNAHEHAGLATVLFSAGAIIAAIAGLGHRRAVYLWLRARSERQLVPAVAAAVIVLIDGPYSPSWWIAQALLFTVAAVASARTTLLASLATATAYVAGTLLRGDPLFPSGNTEYLPVALSLAINPLVAHSIAELFARFTLRLHQIELHTTEPRRPPIRVDAIADAGPDSAERAPGSRKRPMRRPRLTGSRLTARQLEVVMLARDGLRQPEIAAALSISPRQVERHLEQARERAGAATTAQLIAMLITAGLVPPVDKAATKMPSG